MPDVAVQQIDPVSGVFAAIFAEQGRTIASQGAAATHQMAFLHYLAANKWDEVALVEAAAAKELAKSGIGTDLAGIRAGANTPPLPTQGSGA